jgi:hypothetical protein
VAGEQISEFSQPTERVLAEYLTRARLPEALRVVQLVKAELSRRGIVLNWSISQFEIDDPCRSHEPGPEA